MRTLPTLTTVCLLAYAAAGAVAQTPGDTLRAVRVGPDERAPAVDGLLSDPVWQRARPISGFRQIEPFEGEPAREQTEVRIAYDAETLYVGVRAVDSSPNEVVARMLQRDRVMTDGGFGGLSFAGDDGVAIVFDPFHDHRNGVVFATNANGAEFDALLTDEGSETNIDWRGVWEVRSARTPDGWSAEFAIPFRTLRYPESSDGALWGFNVFRVVQRTQEESIWRAWSRDGGGFDRISQAGHIAGLENLPRQGLNVEVKPFATGGLRQDLDRDGSLASSGDFDGGLDVKSEVVPGLVLDLTLNTDFAQVEVDDQQVNLTRFDLFFPEKRDFFLENAGIFEFGQRGFGGPPPYLMFFSRNIGFSDEGEIPIIGGARLTGRLGSQTLGFLSIVTDGALGVESETFNVARIKRDVGASAFLGAMITNRRGDGPASTSVGVDGQVYLDPTLELSGFAARSFTEGPGGEGNAFQVSLDWTTDVWGGFVEHFAIEDGAVARSGFITRTDIRQTQLAGRRRFRPDWLGLRRTDVRLRGEYDTRMDGSFQGWSAGPSLSATFESGATLDIQVNASETQVDEAFDLADIVPVPAGRYRSDEWSISGATTGARPWVVSANVGAAESFGGDRFDIGGSLNVTPTPSFSFTGGFQRNEVDLPGGAFTADITTFRVAWALSTRVTTDALIQHNSLTDRIVTNVRFNFIHRPGSDLFVVFTEGRGVEDELWDVRDRGLVVKLTYLQRL